jgi:hypothetical protein
MTTKRDSNGRFASGNAGGPGRPKRQTEQQYLATMTNVVDDEAWRKIVERAKEDAMNGDHRARAWLSGYMLGTPIQRVESSTGKMGQYLEALQAGRLTLDETDEDGEE